MSFRLNATIDGNSHKGLLALNSITQSNLVVTGLSLTNAQPLHVAIVDGSGSQIVPATVTGKTLKSAGGSASSSGDNTLVVAGTNRLKVYAFSLTTLSTVATTCIFQSGASGTELWRVTLQAITGASTGANLSVAVPAWLFATASATLLNLNLSQAQTVHWSVAYWDEA